MSIAEKLTTIAENEQKVYDAGYKKGKTEGGGYDYLPATTTIKIPDWNLLGKKEVILNIPHVTSYQNMMQQAVLNTSVEHLTINGSQEGNITAVGYAFSSDNTFSTKGDLTLKKITLNCNLSNNASFGRMFYALRALEIIDGAPLDFSSSTSNGNAFGGCVALKSVRFKPLSIIGNIDLNYASELTDETIQSAIDGLADLTGQTARTITWHSTVMDKLTTKQVDQITAKNWLYG